MTNQHADFEYNANTTPSSGDRPKPSLFLEHIMAISFQILAITILGWLIAWLITNFPTWS